LDGEHRAAGQRDHALGHTVEGGRAKPVRP
jgi:hypothetical protein